MLSVRLVAWTFHSTPVSQHPRIQEFEVILRNVCPSKKKQRNDPCSAVQGLPHLIFFSLCETVAIHRCPTSSATREPAGVGADARHGTLVHIVTVASKVDNGRTSRRRRSSTAAFGMGSVYRVVPTMRSLGGFGPSQTYFHIIYIYIYIRIYIYIYILYIYIYIYHIYISYIYIYISYTYIYTYIYIIYIYIIYIYIIYIYISYTYIYIYIYIYIPYIYILWVKMFSEIIPVGKTMKKTQLVSVKSLDPQKSSSGSLKVMFQV